MTVICPVICYQEVDVTNVILVHISRLYVLQAYCSTGVNVFALNITVYHVLTMTIVRPLESL